MAWFVLNLDETTRRVIQSIASSLASIDGTLRDIRFSLARPGALGVVFLRKDKNMIQFKVVLPPVVDTDVVSRELSVQVADGEPTVATLTTDQTEADGFSGPQDAAVKLSLVDIDDAGNRSEPSTLDATLADVFPPAKPGELSLVQTGETN